MPLTTYIHEAWGFIKQHWIIVVIITVIILSIAGYFIYKYMQANSIIDPSTATVSDSMFNYIKSTEGLSLTAYKDTGGVLTIGYGHTGNDVYAGQIITEAQAENLLQGDIQEAVAKVISVVSAPITQNQLDALTDFIFNTGATKSTLFTYVNSNDWTDAAAFLTNHYITDASGNQLAGLVSRREYEANLIT